MFRFLLKLGGALILLAALLVIVDNWMAADETSGLGYTLPTDQILVCTCEELGNVGALRRGSELTFIIHNTDQIGSLTPDTMPLPGAKLRAKVLDVGQSKSQPGRKVALFDFTHLVIGSRQVEFDGYVSMNVERPRDSLHTEGRFLGSFVGMEGGAPAILAGTVIGGRAIDSWRRHTKSPVNYAVSPGLRNNEQIPVRAYRPAYIPLDVKTSVKNDAPKWRQVFDSLSVAFRRRVINPIKRQIG